MQNDCSGYLSPEDVIGTHQAIIIVAWLSPEYTNKYLFTKNPLDTIQSVLSVPARRWAR